MAKNRLFKPHRGNKSTMNTGIKKTMVLAAGEMFIEVPDTGQGTGHCKMKIGDGMNIYPNLPYAMGDITNDVIEVIEEDESPDVETALNKIKSGAKLNTIISALKRTCQLVEVSVTVDLIQKIYPVGSIFLTTSNINPGTYLGGTWELLKDRFLVGAGGSYSAGSTGGQSTVTLSSSQIPAHNHPLSGNTGGWSGFISGVPHPSVYYNDGYNNHYITSNKGKSGTDSILGTGSPSDAHKAFVNAGDTQSGSWNHTHSLNGSTANNTGGGQAHENKPPYLAVYMWKRTA